MKKIMFNDKYGLTQAVLEGRKTMTRRNTDLYEVGEVVAIAQSYSALGYSASEYCEVKMPNGGTRDGTLEELMGWSNKMYVKAERMPHHIRILSRRQEHLQDIGNGDCIREGIFEDDVSVGYSFYNGLLYRTPRIAFAELIDKVSGKGTWESNPLVWVYEFELID